MFVREYGLVHNPGDAERFVRLVKWEIQWYVSPHDPSWDVKTVIPIVWEWWPLDVSNPRSLNYSGPVWKLLPTAISEGKVRHWPVRWPNDAPTETEDMRRERIRVLRRAIHVDPEKANAEPEWFEAAETDSAAA